MSDYPRSVARSGRRWRRPARAAVATALGLLLGAAHPGVAQQAPPPAPAEVAPRGWLGVSVEFALTTRPQADRSVVIAAVQEGGPAARAGVRPGDRLTALNGDNPQDGLAGMLAGLRPGEPVTLELERAGTPLTLSFAAGTRPLSGAAPMVPRITRVEVRADTLADRLYRAMDSLRVHLALRSGGVRVEEATESVSRVRIVPGDSVVVERILGWDTVREVVVRPGTVLPAPTAPESRSFRVLVLGDSTATAPAAPGIPSSGRSPVVPRAEAPPRGPLAPYVLGQNRVAGVEIVPLNPELATYFEVDRGVLVVEVSPGTPAHRAGLRPGDVLTHIEQSAVGSLAGVRRALAVPRDSLAIRLVRRGETREIWLRR